MPESSVHINSTFYREFYDYREYLSWESWTRLTRYDGSAGHKPVPRKTRPILQALGVKRLIFYFGII